MVAARSIDSPVGILHLRASDRALIELLFECHRAEVGDVVSPKPDGFDVPNAILDQAEQELGEYFQGQRQVFSVPVDPVGTPFQREVWAELRKIPFGQTISYIELARRMGDSKKTRAVGLANGRNPISILIPCHRVIGANGHLVGYGGGIANKRWLIDFEASDRLF